MPTRPRREKRIHRQHDEQCCRWILFCGSAKRASGVREKRWGKRCRWRSEPRAARTGRKKVGRRGMKKSGDALSKRAGESKKRTGESKKRAGESKNKGRAIEKQGSAESKCRGRNSKECGVRNQKARGRGFRKRAICPPPCRDEEFG